MEYFDVFKEMEKVASRYGHYLFTDDAGFSVHFHHRNTLFRVSTGSIQIRYGKNAISILNSQIKSIDCDLPKRKKGHIRIVAEGCRLDLQINRWGVWA